MCWWVKTKSAPLPERPCEQLTYCAKNESEQWDYINRATKRHNCRITGKTKAIRYGGPSTLIARYPQRMSIANNATFAAGGQRVNSLNFAQLRCAGLSFSYTKSGISFSALPHVLSLSAGSLLMQYFMRNANTNRDPSQYSIWCISYSLSVSLDFLRWRNFSSCSTFSGKNPADLFSGSNGLLSVCFLVIHQPFCSLRCHTCNGRVFLYSFRNISRANAHGANLSDSCSSAIFSCSLFVFCDGVLVDSLLVIVCSCKAMRRSSSHHGADSDYSDSLALRRCSYFNLRPQASKTHAEKLALGLVNFSCSTLASISSISSCGNRMFFFADLLFVFPLDIGTPHLNGFDGRTQYSKKSEKLSIDMCAHMILICAHSLGCIAQIKQRPAVLTTHAGRLTTNDNDSIEVAMRNHTTHPQGRDSHNLNKYIWRFIALSTAQPRVITIEATSEQEARQQSPAGCVMVFAARIRQGVRHVQ